jgi:type VI secretion system FHA domain protein
MKNAPTLTLEVTSQQADALGPDRRKAFGAEGGTIGRAAGNRWVLAEGYVSSRHAAIGFSNGTFHIEDLGSTNGVYVNDRRLELNSPCALTSGDRIFIEPYEIVASVAIVAPTAPAFPSSDPLPDSEGDNWLDELAPPVWAPVRREQVPSLGNHPLKEYVPPAALVSPPSVPAAPVHIPAGYNPLLRPEQAPPSGPAPRVERRVRDRRSGDRRAAMNGGPAPAASSGVDLRALLSGAGLEGFSVTPEVARQFGQILRVVVTGVLEVLRARQEVKGEFRIKPTIIQPRRNNPLKHSTDAEDALHNLLLKRGPAYLGPVEAFEDAFRDLRDHQIAMLAGVREAFEAMFRQFDPDRLQKEFDHHTPKVKKGPLAALQAKPDYWEFYRDWVQRLSNDADGTFRNLFGQEFAKAYEEQLERLKSLPPAADGKRER